MKPDKEKVLLAVVLAVVGAKAAHDRTRAYRPVPLPQTSPPRDVPAPPEGSPSFARSAPPAKRSMFEIFSSLRPADPVDLPEVPAAAVPVAVPAVRPFPHLDAARNLRHLLFDPPVVEEPQEDANTGGGTPPPPPPDGTGGDEASPRKTEEEKAPPPDLSQFDWVRQRVPGSPGGGGKLYGRIDILGKDRDAGKTKYDLLVDDAMEFTINILDPRTGTFPGGAQLYRDKAEELGFANNIANRYWTRRKRMEKAAGHATLDLSLLRQIAAETLDDASRNRAERRQGWTLAADTYREVLQRNTDDKDTLRDLGKVYRLLQDLDAETALYAWWIGNTAAGRDEEILSLQGDTYDLLGLPERALSFWNEALRTARDPRVRLRVGETLLGTGSLEDARKAAEQFRRAAQEGERTAGTVGEARALLAVGDFAGAKAALGRVASDAERDSGWYNAMGAILYCAEDLEGARAHFQAALDRAPPASLAAGISRTNLAVAKARLAGLLAEDDTGRKTLLEEALKNADDALKDDPFNYYWPLVAKGYAWRLLGKPEKAVESLQEAVAADPGEANGRVLLGEFLLRDGRRMEGRTHFLEATRLAPGYPDALGGVGRAGGGEAGEAKDYLRRASSLEPRNALWPLLGARASLNDEALPQKVRLQEAQKDLAYILDRVDPNSFVALAAMGWVRYYLEDADEALDRWDKAIRLVSAFKSPSAREMAYVQGLKDWLVDAHAAVYRWQGTRIWRDEFKRAKGPNIGNGWIEDEKAVKWSIDEDGVHLGPGRLGKEEVPGIRRSWDSRIVLRAEVTFVVAREEPEELDVRFWMPQGKTRLMEMGIRKTEDGQARLLLKPDNRTKDNEMIKDLPGFTWPADGRVTFGFARLDEAAGKVSLSVNGKVIPGFESLEIQTLAKTKGGEFRVEINCRAAPGAEVRAKVEAVEVWLDTHVQ